MHDRDAHDRTRDRNAFSRLAALPEPGLDRGAADRRRSPAWRERWPVTRVHAGAPPFLILQGTEDLLVPVAHARTLSDRLTAAGVPVTLLLVEHAGHGLRSVGGEPAPSRIEVIQRIAEFFDRDRSGRGSSDRMKAGARAARGPSGERIAYLHAHR